MTSTDNIIAGAKAASNEGIKLLQGITTYAILPLVCVVLVILLLFFIVGAASKKKMGEDFQDDIKRCLIVLVILAMAGTFTVWGWTMAGASTAGTGAAAASVLLTRAW